MKRQILILITLIIPGIAMSQGAQDVLRYSRYQNWGTARYMAAGGAFSALGADFTLASVNPAGIAFYKTSEFIITPAMHFQNTQSRYNGFSGSDSKANFYLGNLGIVISTGEVTARNNKGWKNFQFATGLNRIKDFNSRVLINGPNPQNSLLDVYRDYAQGPPQIPYQEIEDDLNYTYADDLNLAWWTFLLDVTDSVDYDYTTPLPYAGAFQTKTIETRGSINEYVITGSANYNNRLYMGITLGIPMVRYFRESVFIEDDIADTIHDFNRYSRQEYLKTTGGGINFKLGLIYRVTDWLRIGGAFHTPTWYTLNDTWWTTMESEFDNGDQYSATSPNGEFEYKINTPLRAIGSVGFIFGERGFISVEYEFADYSTGKLKSSFGNHSEANATVRSSYAAAHHVRLGTEWRFEHFSFRAGYGYAGSPYKNDINDGKSARYSAGIGYRKLPFLINIAFVHQRTSQDYYLYTSPVLSSNPSDNLHISNHFVLTFGYRF